MELRYFTRDAKGNDIEKIIVTKQYESQRKDFLCPICKKRQTIGIPIKSIVSSKFTDWAYVDDFICEDCSSLFSLYFYSYIITSLIVSAEITIITNAPFIYVVIGMAISQSIMTFAGVIIMGTISRLVNHVQ